MTAIFRHARRVALVVGALWLSVAYASSAAAQDTPPPMMVLPGQADVSATGAFTYSIPIEVPPGSAGMAPSLSLDYSSQTGDGYQGLGWSIRGLPSIGRCPNTLAQDGVHGGVNYNTHDRYCLEGQRLVAVEGAYGADQTEYRTEIDKFTKIISYGAAGNGPRYFRVWTKAGQIMEFGNTDDSRFLAQGKDTAAAWAVNRIADTSGNYLTVTYNLATSTERVANGEIYPIRINYTGNDRAGQTPLGAFNRVEFNYQQRSGDYWYSKFHAGSRQKTTRILTGIQAFNGSTLVSDYRLAYRAPTNAVQRYELTSVTRCDGSAPAKCLPPTTFTWQGSGHAPAFTAVPNGFSQNDAAYPGDFNGDGLTDALIPNGDCKWNPGANGQKIGDQPARFLYDRDNDRFICPSSAQHVFSRPLRGNADVNADGLTDLFMTGTGPTGFTTIYMSRGQDPNNPNRQLFDPFSFANTRFFGIGDFNGDGRSDFNDTTTSSSVARLSLGDGSFTSDNSHPTSRAPYLDFDADGCTDAGGPNDNAILFCNPAPPAIAVPTWPTAQVVNGDFNGDGLPDFLVAYGGISEGGKIYLSTGEGTEAVTTYDVPGGWGQLAIYAGDYNGDGRTDVLLVSPANRTSPHEVWVSSGRDLVKIAEIAKTDTQESVAAVVADWNSDGADDFILKKASGDVEYVFSYVPELLKSVDNGIGATTSATYDRLNQNTFYTEGSGTAYPGYDLNGPYYVVKSLDRSNGVGGEYETTYAYHGGRTDLRGRGFLGFERVTATDPQTGVVREATYRQDFPYAGLMAANKVTAPKDGGGTVVVSSTTNSFKSKNLSTGSVAPRYFVSMTQSLVTARDLDGSVIPTVTTTYGFDCDSLATCYGNLTSVGVTTPDGASKVTTHLYGAEDPTDWILGRITRTTIVAAVPGAASVTRTRSFRYDAATGILDREVIEPDAPNTTTLRLETEYELDRFGNRETATVRGVQITDRVTANGYDSRGRFLTGLTNPKGQSEGWTYNVAFGAPETHTDLNGLITTWENDGFGRRKLELRPDGTRTTIAYEYCSAVNGGTASCPTHGAFVVTATPLQTNGTTQFGPIAKRFYDSLGRLIATDTQGFDGVTIRTAQTYDSKGRIDKVSRPYFITAAPLWTTNSYDALGRLKQAERPDDSIWKYGYEGLTTTATDGNDHKTTTTRNAQGRIKTVTNAANKTTTYLYNGFGDLLSVTDPEANVTSAQYDVRGRKITSVDPDMGSWSYAYDVLDQLKSQTDAKSQTTTFQYDVLGRLEHRTAPDLVSNWTYDTAANGIGKLHVASTAAGYARTHSYDELSRPSHAQIVIGGGTFNYTYRYYANRGVLNFITFPGGLSAQYQYNQYGYQTAIVDRADSNIAFWTANARNADLLLTSETADNGVVTTRGFDPETGRITSVRAGVGGGGDRVNLHLTFDPVGNLRQRRDQRNDLTEDFTYTNLDQLDTYSSPSGAKNVDYSPIGNITVKSDAGTYHYGAGTAGPHAVTSIGNTTYGYDLNGNMITQTISGVGTTVFYNHTSFNKPESITIEPGITVSYEYDAEQNRIVQRSTPPNDKTLYANDPVYGMLTELYVPPSGPNVWHNYLIADGRLVMERADNGSTVELRYLTTDHLGSVIAITGASGALLQKQSFDPWGSRRNADGTTPFSGTPLTSRGFTGQESAAQIGLINFNARLYDQTLGRFISPDPTIPDPWDAQSWNRYSYVNNRPLSLVDPSGYNSTTIRGLVVTGTRQVPVWEPREVRFASPAWLLQQAYAGLRVGVPRIPSVVASASGQIAGVKPSESGFTEQDSEEALGLDADDPFGLHSELNYELGGRKFIAGSDGFSIIEISAVDWKKIALECFIALQCQLGVDPDTKQHSPEARHERPGVHAPEKPGAAGSGPNPDPKPVGPNRPRTVVVPRPTKPDERSVIKRVRDALGAIGSYVPPGLEGMTVEDVWWMTPPGTIPVWVPTWLPPQTQPQ